MALASHGLSDYNSYCCTRSQLKCDVRQANTGMSNADTRRHSGVDLSELRHNLQDCNKFHNAVGSLNPRNPGLHNNLIQFAKKLMRRSLSWYTRPLHQFQGAATRSLNELAKAVENCQTQLAKFESFEQGFEHLELSWRQNLPAFLNAVSTVNAFGHELMNVQRELGQALQELQSLRGELRQQMAQLMQASALLGSASNLRVSRCCSKSSMANMLQSHLQRTGK